MKQLLRLNQIRSTHRTSGEATVRAFHRQGAEVVERGQEAVFNRGKMDFLRGHMHPPLCQINPQITDGKYRSILLLGRAPDMAQGDALTAADNDAALPPEAQMRA